MIRNPYGHKQKMSIDSSFSLGQLKEVDSLQQI